MLKIITKALTLLKSKLNPKDALLLELLKENKELKLKVKHQKQVLGSEILKLREELYAERLYNRVQNKETNKQETKCKKYIVNLKVNYNQVYA